jgi:activator of HSP90 ATPase
MTLPSIKKKISSFLIGEEGQISKKALVGLGIALAGVGVQSANAAHTSNTVLTYPQQNLIGQHTSASTTTTSTTSTTTTSTTTTSTTSTTSTTCVTTTTSCVHCACYMACPSTTTTSTTSTTSTTGY